MSDVNLYDRIVTPYAVEQALVATIDLWIDDYLGELERIEGYAPNKIARPRGVMTASTFAKWEEDQLPVIVVMNAGLAAAPIRRGDGVWEATWAVGCAPICGDVDEIETRRLALTYATAVKAAVLQHKMLKSALHPDGFASALMWTGETYGDIPFGDSRTLATGAILFSITVENVVSEQAGPREPSGEPEVDPGPNPNITDVKVGVTPEPIGV